MKIREIKKYARQQLKGNYTALIGVVVLTFVMTLFFVAAFLGIYILGILGVKNQAEISAIHPYAGTVLISLFGMISAALVLLFIYLMIGISRGMVLMLLHIAAGQKESAFHVFRGFHADGAGFKNYAGTTLILLSITIILLIPEVLVGFKFGFASQNYRVTSDLVTIVAFIVSMFTVLALFISAHQPEMTPIKCIRTSAILMRNQKWKYVGLIFSFIGWILLCIVTRGLACFFVVPYIRETMVVFYLDAASEMFRKVVGTEEYRKAVQEEAQTEEESWFKSGDYREVSDTEAANGSSQYAGTVNTAENSNMERQAAEPQIHATGAEENSNTSDAGAPVYAEASVSADVPSNPDAKSHAGMQMNNAASEPKTNATAVQSKKTDTDGIRSYEEWKKSHGITIDNNLGDIKTGENENHPEVR
jgi:uncharacterized membrane protein